jgi:transcriptional regulator with PAS, ATPase and Fis domain
MDRIKINSLAKALRKTGGNVRKACKLLGISPDTAYRWINQSVELSELLDRLREYGPDEEEE